MLQKNIAIKTIDAIDFSNLYKEKVNNILLIDVRENKEFSNFSIAGSISIPLSDLEQKPNLENIRKESAIKEIYTICQLGKRSKKASKILSKFKIESKSIEGGIDRLKNILKN